MNNKVDVIHIISGDLWAGAESQIYHSLVLMYKQNLISFKVIVFNNGVLSEKLKSTGINVAVIDEAESKGKDIILELRKQILFGSPNIVHVHGFKEHILGYLANLVSGNRSVMVRTFHGMSIVLPGLSWFKHIKSTIVHMFERKLLNSSKIYIVAVSEDLKTFLSSSFPRANIMKIYNGIADMGNHKDCRNDLREQYNLKQGEIWIGTAARLTYVKNLDMLIRVGKGLKEKGVNFRISIFGEGNLKNELQLAIAQNGISDCVYLEGFTDEIIPIISSLDYFVMTSEHEGLPMSLLEAMFLETPVICTAVGGIKEVVLNNETGFLVPSNDADAMVNAILKLDADVVLREDMVLRARERVFSVFSIENCVAQITYLYQSVMGKV